MTLQINAMARSGRMNVPFEESLINFVAKSSHFVKENLEDELPLCRDENGVARPGASTRSGHFRWSFFLHILWHVSRNRRNAH